MRQISPRGRKHVADWEGKRGKAVLKAYRDGGGVPTIGYGHTKGVAMGMTCTEALAMKWLDEDLDESEAAVSRLVKVPLNDNQFAALVSFVFNVGVAAFKASTLLRLLNKSQYDAVPAQLMRWTKDRNPRTGKMEVVPGLVNRRAADSALWSEPMYDDERPESLQTHSPVQTGRRPEPPPAPTKVLETSTGKAQATALVAGSTAGALEVVNDSNFGDTLREALGHVEGLVFVMESAKFLLVIGTLALIGWTLWDRRRKLQENGQ